MKTSNKYYAVISLLNAFISLKLLISLVIHKIILPLQLITLFTIIMIEIGSIKSNKRTTVDQDIKFT